MALTRDQKYVDGADLKAVLGKIKGIIDAKVNTTDIVDNLTSTDTNKPLSAAQGKELKSMLDNIVGLDIHKVDSVANLPVAPTAAEKKYMYIVPNGETVEGSKNIYDEYLWIATSETEGTWEKMGTTDIDISKYATKEDVTVLTTAETDAIFDEVFTV